MTDTPQAARPCSPLKNGKVTGTKRLGAVPRPARARPANRRRCRTADAACTAAPALARARLRASSASVQLALSMGDIAMPPSLNDVRRAPSSGLSGPSCEVTPQRSKKWNRRWMRSGEPPDEQASSLAEVARLRELRRKLQAEVARLEAEKQGWLVEKARDGPNASALGVEPGPASYKRAYSADYVGHEAKAKADRLGVHAHACQPAWEWRAQQRAKNGQ